MDKQLNYKGESMPWKQDVLKKKLIIKCPKCGRYFLCLPTNTDCRTCQDYYTYGKYPSIPCICKKCFEEEYKSSFPCKTVMLGEKYALETES